MTHTKMPDVSLKKIYVKTYGCQMNVYDSDRMAQMMGAHGYVLVDSPDDANITLVNTCHIREKATEKVFSELGRLKKHKMKKLRQGEEGLLVVAGCVAQAEGEEITRRAPYVDVVVGPQVYHRLPQLVEQAKRKATDKRNGIASSIKDVMDTNFPLESKFDFLSLPEANQSVSAFLSIQEGCDKFCTYCVVPYTRGAEYSRPVSDILTEARHLVSQGVKEITLLGQNVNAYHGASPQGAEWGLGALCLELAQVPDLERIRYTTSHPKDMDADLIAAHGSCTKLMPFLHLPVQSGSERILSAMNRYHTGDRYREIIAELRAVRPDIGFSSDFIVGFPGETESDFEETLQLVRDINYAQAYSFKYSSRPGTPASVMDHPISVLIQEERLQRLQTLLAEQQVAFNQSFLGRTIDVLIEKKGTKPRQYVGKSPYMQSVYVDLSVNAPGQEHLSCDMIGKTLPITITEAGFKALHGYIRDARAL